MKKLFKMTNDQLTKLLEASKPTRVMYVSGGIPIGGTPQENANQAWQELGKDMGFEWETVSPAGTDQTEFYAEPIFKTEQTEEKSA